MVLEQRRKTTARYTAAVAVAVLLAACGAEDTPPPNSAELPPSIEQLQAEAAPFAGRSVSDLRGDPSALATGRRLFEARCASCHGADARGGRNVTDLVDGVFAYGGSESAIRTTIGQGRTSVMPDMGSSLGEVDLGQLVAYVQSLNFEAPLSSYAERGKMLFEANCAKCHGADGRGNAELGASNLTDGYWQHGESMMNIRLVITRGTQSQCPGLRGDSIPAELDLLTAFVLQLRDSDGTGIADGSD
jgi:cytochrome c oxidase cbb3-type subunit 3